MRKRHTWTYWYYHVECRDCGWKVEGKNGLGLAAQHHDRTGHTIVTEVEGTVSYLSEIENARRRKERGDLLNLSFRSAPSEIVSK